MSLYDELTTGSLAAEIAPFIASGNDGAISEILNRKNITVLCGLTSHDIKQYLSLVGLRLPIIDSTAPACREATQALDDFDLFALDNPTILAKFSAILDGLVAETLIPYFTETHKATILYLANKQISRAEQLGMTIYITSIAQSLRS